MNRIDFCGPKKIPSNLGQAGGLGGRTIPEGTVLLGTCLI